jgi:hypothetical protein
MQRNVRLVAIASFLLTSACAFFSVYSSAVHRPIGDALVDEWLDITFERRRLAGLDATGVLIEPEDYERELAQLSAKEQTIVSDNEFPADERELGAFLLTRATGNHHSISFWLLLVASGTTFVAAVSWLHGHSTRDSNADSGIRQMPEQA